MNRFYLLFALLACCTFGLQAQNSIVIPEGLNNGMDGFDVTWIDAFIEADTTAAGEQAHDTYLLEPGGLLTSPLLLTVAPATQDLSLVALNATAPLTPAGFTKASATLRSTASTSPSAMMVWTQPTTKLSPSVPGETLLLTPSTTAS